jgi:hypothetical protein
MARRDHDIRRNPNGFFNPARNPMPQTSEIPIMNSLVAKKFPRHCENAPDEPVLALSVRRAEPQCSPRKRAFGHDPEN